MTAPFTTGHRRTLLPMPSTDRIAAHARSSGALARSQGRPISDNTYCVQQVGHAEWIKGWNEENGIRQGA